MVHYINKIQVCDSMTLDQKRRRPVKRTHLTPTGPNTLLWQIIPTEQIYRATEKPIQTPKCNPTVLH